jgi:hypothetical protein
MSKSMVIEWALSLGRCPLRCTRGNMLKLPRLEAILLQEPLDICSPDAPYSADSVARNRARLQQLLRFGFPQAQPSPELLRRHPFAWSIHRSLLLSGARGPSTTTRRARRLAPFGHGSHLLEEIDCAAVHQTERTTFACRARSSPAVRHIRWNRY